MSNHSKSDTDDPEMTGMQSAAFKMLDAFQEQAAGLIGFATHLESNGWTPEQARAIVAFHFGWRPADGSKPEGAE